MRASSLVVQERQEGARHAHDGVEVDRHQPVEVVLADLLEGAAEGDAGVVDEQVDPAVGGAHRGRQRRHRGAIGDVDACAAGANAERFRLARRRGEAGRVDVDQRQMAAAARQRERDARGRCRSPRR